MRKVHRLKQKLDLREDDLLYQHIERSLVLDERPLMHVMSS